MRSKHDQWFISQVALGSGVNPIAVFLASDDSTCLTGEQLLATGGIR